MKKFSWDTLNLRTINKDKIMLGVAVLAILITGVLVFANSSYGSSLSFLKSPFGMSQDAIAKKTISYINANLLSAGQSAALDSVSSESGVVKVKVKITDSSGTKSYDSYVTKDGKLFFPQAFDISGTAAPAAAAAQPAASATPPANLAKVDKPLLEAYVVSSCPYGLQMQRAMADAVAKVPALAESIKVRYIGAVSGNTITAMHGVEEAQENLRQICIREEQPTKYWSYVSCYMQKSAGTASNGMPYGDSKACQTATGIDSAKLNACVADSSRGLAYAKADFALDTKYNIQGSPTLVLNGSQIVDSDFGGRSSDGVKTMVCASSKNAPSFCSTTLNTAQAATSFALAYAPAGGAAAGNTSAACAPVAN